MDHSQSLELDLQLQYTKGNDRDYCWIVNCELQHHQNENGYDLFIRHDSSVSIDSYPNKRTGKISIKAEFPPQSWIFSRWRQGGRPLEHNSLP